MELEQILRFAVTHGFSDVHLTVGRRPYFRKEGKLVYQNGSPVIEAAHMDRWCEHLLKPDARKLLTTNRSVDASYQLLEVGRFRVSAYHQRGHLAVALRHVPTHVPSLEELGLPEALNSIVMAPRGIVLVTGATGSGKSTTLAAMIQAINQRTSRHILTIEDPIEYVFEESRSIVSQREIGVDANSFSSALRSALRQDPDVLYIGELRDLETTEVALQAAETGHLVLSTMHTVDAVESIHRFVSLFPPYQQPMVRRQLSSVLTAVISQRLVETIDGGRAPACEIMVQTELIRELISDADRTHELRDIMAKGRTTYGMQTFDQALADLAEAGRISQEVAMHHARNPSDMRLSFDGIAGIE